jgi:N,N'-diacetyllegionaminate synthase
MNEDFTIKTQFMRIGDFVIGDEQPCFIIAEAGVNHNGQVELARQLIDAAKQAGASAIKFQTFRAEKLATPDAPQAEYQTQNTGNEESQLAMLQRLELSEEAHRLLFDYCHEKGILFLSTPFDEESADFLDTLPVVAFKVGSGELTNLPFLSQLARKGKPIILSTGMASLAEVEMALRALKDVEEVALLHCISSYPTPPHEVNLRAMNTLRMAFQVPVGYSDHTEGIEIALGAAALGANIIEKHFTLSRALPGPDHQASLEPHELTAMITHIRSIEAALGHGRKEPTLEELETAKVVRRSLVAAQNIATGTVLTEQHVTTKRPGIGMPPQLWNYVIGRTAKRDIPENTLLSFDLLL